MITPLALNNEIIIQRSQFYQYVQQCTCILLYVFVNRYLLNTAYINSYWIQRYVIFQKKYMCISKKADTKCSAHELYTSLLLNLSLAKVEI
jgi:hypothetical protein